MKISLNNEKMTEAGRRQSSLARLIFCALVTGEKVLTDKI